MHATVIGLAGIAGLMWTAVSCARRWVPPWEDIDAADLIDPHMHMCRIHGHRVAFSERGAGEPATVFLHGFGGNCRVWDAVQTALAPSTRTIAVDLLGFGSSDRPIDLTPYHWPDQVRGLLDYLQIDRAVIVGHSLGGRAAILTAATYPERIHGLCVVNSDGIEIPSQWAIYRLLSNASFTSLLLKYFQRDRRFLGNLLQFSYHPSYTMGFNVVEEFQRQMRVRGTLDSWSHLSQYYAGNKLKDLAARIQCPTKIIWGEQDTITPPTCARYLHRLMRQAELVVLPNVGHVPHIEAPEQFLTHFRLFLNSLQLLQG